MGTIIICTLVGAGIGAVGAVALYVLGFGVELLNCACQIITYNCDGDAIPGMWEGGSFLSVFLFCLIAGAVIGFIYGIYKVKAASDAETARKEAENSEAARKQRTQWASEVKQKALNVSNTCESNNKNVSPLVCGTYEAEKQMELILAELASAAELMGKIDAMADDVKKGGASK